MNLKKISENTYQIVKDSKKYELTFSTWEKELQISLLDKQSSEYNPIIYRSSFGIEALVKINNFFKQFDTIYEVLESVKFFVEDKKPEILIEKNQAILVINYVIAEVRLHLPLIVKTQEEIYKTFFDVVAQAKKKIETKFKEVNKLISAVRTIEREKDHLVKVNHELTELSKKLKTENEELNKIIIAQKNNSDVNNSCITEKKFHEILEQKFQVLHQDIQDVKHCISRPIIENKEPKDITTFLSGDLLIENSIAKTKQEKDLLCKWINGKKKKITTELLYKASRDGDKASIFHEKCNGKGATLTLIKNSNGFQFGGFTMANWVSGGGACSSDEKAFIFSLNTKKMFKVKEKTKAIYCESNYGPCFGYCGTDICIKDNFLTNNNSTSNTPFNYECSSKSELTGGNPWYKVTELEVYKVSF